jgi:hypothetical protein
MKSMRLHRTSIYRWLGNTQSMGRMAALSSWTRRDCQSLNLGVSSDADLSASRERGYKLYDDIKARLHPISDRASAEMAPAASTTMSKRRQGDKLSNDVIEHLAISLTQSYQMSAEMAVLHLMDDFDFDLDELMANLNGMNNPYLVVLVSTHSL